MIKKGCLLGVLSFSLLATVADAKKTEPPRTKAEPSAWEALVRTTSPNRPFNRTFTCPAPEGGNCKIVVTMGEKCVTTQKPKDEYLRVKKDVTIFWQLDTATARNWRFDSTDGVKFDDPAAPFDNQASTPVLFKWHAKIDAAWGLWHYKIKLVSRSGSQTCLVDPAIWI